MRAIASAVVLLALAVPRASTAAPNVQLFGRTVRPLLYVTAAESGDGGAHWTKSQIYIFRDGTVVTASVGQAYTAEPVTGAFLFSGIASPQRLKELGVALTNARVGYQKDCEIDPPDSPLEWNYKFQWFGIGERQNTFEAKQQTGPACPFEIEQLIDAVTLIRGSAYQSATTKLVIP